ncbi:MAG: hypothetical protein ABR502_04180 [Chitinophagaceae bacterium]
MRKFLFIFFAAILTIFTQCDTLKNLPTNTSGGLFSLNGNWRLATSSDNRALEGTVVTVVPGIANAAVRTLNNNTYCLRDADILWRGVKAFEGGTFSMETLVNACGGTAVYKPATITVLTNDEIRVTGHTVTGAELIQTWRRAFNQ